MRDHTTFTVPAEAIRAFDIVEDRWAITGRPLTVAETRPAEGEGIDLRFIGDPVADNWQHVHGPVEIHRPKALLASHYTVLAEAAAAGAEVACALSDLLLGVQAGGTTETMGFEMAGARAALDSWRHLGRTAVA